MPFEPSRAGAGLGAVSDAARSARQHYAVWRRTRVGLRGLLLYVLAAPLPFAAIVALAGGGLSAAAASAAAFVLISLGASLNRRGMLEELVAPERRFTRSLRLPHKYLAVLSIGAGTAVAAYGAVGQSAPVSLVFALLAGLGFHLSYRLPAPASVLGLTRERVPDRALQSALEQAERRILSIEKAALSIGNPELEQRLGRIAAKGRAVLQVIVERPGERYRARKFLNVYLEGAERVAGRYARTHRLARGRALEENFRNVLVEIERVFDRQLSRLAEHDVFDLDVQIEVLRRQLEREGIT
jgi:5-bromo-4-chloroindolyl phosphate hydrolysis protein